VRSTLAIATAPADESLQLLFVEDLARMFRIELPAVRKRLRLGQFGPFLRVGKRMAVLRSSLVKYLQDSQIEIV
jgi:hypothetical protein